MSILQVPPTREADPNPARFNAEFKCDKCAYPHRVATSLAGTRPAANNSRANSKRRRITQACGLQAKLSLNMRAKW